MNDLWLILTSIFLSSSCGLLGCYLVLRKMAMVGDAISHAVLPGIVIAYVITESRNSIPMLIGAAILGVLASIMIEFFHQKAKMQEDASIGITFTFLFAVGVILVSLFTGGNVDIDLDCVLYGDIIEIPFDLWILDGSSPVNLGPKALWTSIFLLIIVLAVILIGYKGFLLTTFNPAYAISIGISIAFWHYLLMGLVSLTTVVAFESVGAILVVGFLITNPATAYLLTKSLPKMMFLTIIIGIISSVLGFYLSMLLKGSIAGAITSVSGVLFLLAFFFEPKEGLISKRFKSSEKHLIYPQ